LQQSPTGNQKEGSPTPANPSLTVEERLPGGGSPSAVLPFYQVLALEVLGRWRALAELLEDHPAPSDPAGMSEREQNLQVRRAYAHFRLHHYARARDLLLPLASLLDRDPVTPPGPSSRAKLRVGVTLLLAQVHYRLGSFASCAALYQGMGAAQEGSMSNEHRVNLLAALSQQCVRLDSESVGDMKTELCPSLPPGVVEASLVAAGAEEEESPSYEILYNHACYLTSLGDPQRALDTMYAALGRCGTRTC
jgi:hypothetical protein